MADVSTAVTALAPAFAAGFAVQQGLQILDSLFKLDDHITPVRKTALAGIVSMGLGLAFALPANGIHVLKAMAITTTPYPNWIDSLVSALVISGGTEGFNSIMKFMGYKKDAANPAKTPADNAADHGGGEPNALGKVA